MLQTYKLTHLARLDKKSRDTIKARKDLYLPVRFDSFDSKRTQRGYSVRYARVDDVLSELKNKDDVDSFKLKRHPDWTLPD